MSLFDDIKSTLTSDLQIAEADAHQLATTIVGDAKQTFSGLLDMVVKQVEARPIGQVLEGVYEIYKNVRADSATSSTSATAPSS